MVWFGSYIQHSTSRHKTNRGFYLVERYRSVVVDAADMDQSASSGDEDRDRSRHEQLDRFVRAEGRHHHNRQHLHQHNYNHYPNHHNSRGADRDYDTRSQSSQKSDPNSETSGRGGDTINYNLSATESVGSHGSGGGDRGFPLHGHVHFRHTAMSATHLLNGDPAHQFPPSLYQSSADAPKSDTATVCSGSMLEDIEDVSSHYDGETSQASSGPKQHHHHYPPPTNVRRSNSKEGNRLVDFAERSQAVFPKQSKSSTGGGGAASMMSQESSSSNNDDDHASGSTNLQHRKGMGPPLSRHWLLQQHGSSPFRTGSVKSGGSNAGSDVVVNVGSDCGGSLTDVQSLLSQEDAALLTTANSEASVASGPKTDTLFDAGAGSTGAAGASGADDEKKPHPLLCDQSDSKTGGRVSPGGTIYRGRGVRRYKGRFYALPLKRFHQDGVHLHSDSEPETNNLAPTQHDRPSSQSLSHNQSQQPQRHDDGDQHHYRWEVRHHHGGSFRDDDNYYDHASSSRRTTRDYNNDRGRDRGRRGRGRDRSRSRSRSNSPPPGDRRREARNTSNARTNSNQERGYKIEKHKHK